MINQILKYPRTRHLEGSREQAVDEDLKCVSFEEIRGKFLVLEEKVDGANCGISFDTSGKCCSRAEGITSTADMGRNSLICSSCRQAVSKTG